MCSNYKPVTQQDRLLQYFGVTRPVEETPPELTWPGYLAPFIVRADDRVALERELQLGVYGLLPHWAPSLAFGRKTYNARCETVAEKPSYRNAWRRGHRCIIPAEVLYEPNYESGQAERWGVRRVDGAPMGVAGLWGAWHDAGGQRVLSFTMLTVNGAGHAIYERLHAPGDEKRMPVILDEADYDAWLEAPVSRMGEFMRQFPAERLECFPAPLERVRAARPKPAVRRTPKPEPPPSLF